MGSSESSLVKMPYCLKSHVASHIYYINITFPARVIVENIIPRNVIINRGAAEFDTCNYISRDDIFDCHPSRSCNIYFIIPNRTLDSLFTEVLLLLIRPSEGRSKGENNEQPLDICLNEIKYFTTILNARPDH